MSDFSAIVARFGLLALLLLVALMLSPAHAQSGTYMLIQPGNASLPVWDGNCSTLPCNQTTCTISATVTNVTDPNCLGLTFVGPAVLSGFTINTGTNPFSVNSYYNAQAIVQIGAQNVTIAGTSVVVYGLQMLFNNTGALIINTPQPYSYGNNYNHLYYSSGPGLVMGPFSYVMNWAYSTFTSLNPHALFPIGLASVQSSTFTTCNFTGVSFYNSTAATGSVTLTFTTTSYIVDSIISYPATGLAIQSTSTVSNSSITTVATSMTITSTTFTASSITLSLTSAITMSSVQSSWTTTSITGAIDTYSTSADVVTQNTGATFLTVTGSRNPFLSIGGITTHTTSGSGQFYYINQLFRSFFCVASHLEYTNWSTLNVTTTATSSGCYFSGAVNIVTPSGLSTNMVVFWQNSYHQNCPSSAPCLTISATNAQTVTLNGVFGSAFTDASSSAPSPCHIRLSGAFFLTDMFNADTLCASSTANASISGALPFTVTLAIVSGGSISFASPYPSVTLYPIPVAASLTLPNNNFAFWPLNQTAVNVTGTVFSATSAVVNWTLPYLPTANVPYALLTDNNAQVSLTSVSAPNYAVSLSKSSDNKTYTYMFNPVTCNSSCPSANIAPPCVSSTVCPCLGNWTGPFCDCDPTGLPSGSNLICSPNGGPIYVFNGTTYGTLYQDLTIPSNYTLSAGVFTTYNNIIIQENANLAISVLAQLSTLTLYGKLFQNSTGSTCYAESDTRILTPGQMTTTGSSQFWNLVLDASALTLANDCNGVPTSVKSAVITLDSWQSSFSRPILNITILESSGLDASKLNFSVYIVGYTGTNSLTSMSTQVHLPTSDLCYSWTGTTRYYQLNVFACPPAPVPASAPHAVPVTGPTLVIPAPVPVSPAPTPVSPTPTSASPSPTPATSPVPVSSTPSSAPAATPDSRVPVLEPSSPSSVPSAPSVPSTPSPVGSTPTNTPSSSPAMTPTIAITLGLLALALYM